MMSPSIGKRRIHGGGSSSHRPHQGHGSDCRGVEAIISDNTLMSSSDKLRSRGPECVRYLRSRKTRQVLLDLPG